jgi:hypothetical protein
MIAEICSGLRAPSSWRTSGSIGAVDKDVGATGSAGVTGFTGATRASGAVGAAMRAAADDEGAAGNLRDGGGACARGGGLDLSVSSRVVIGGVE